MLKSVFAATLLCFTAGCYMPDAGQASAAYEPTSRTLVSAVVAERVSEVEALPEPPSALTGDPVADAMNVCALRFMHNLSKVRMGEQPTSGFVEGYMVQHGLTVEQYEVLYQKCEMFDSGILFYVTMNAPAQPVADPKPSLKGWASLNFLSK